MAPFCSRCGASTVLGGMPGFAPQPMAQRPRTSGMAITGFVLAFFCGLLGLVFSILGYNDCRKSSGMVTGKGLALAGIVISILSTIGVIVVWFAFMRIVDDVSKLGSRFDAHLELERMGQSAKEYYLANGEFPRTSAPSTPDHSCCEAPDHKCHERDWSNPAWRTLDFEVYGKTSYRFSYTSDGTKLVAQAVGDPNCDGDEITYQLTVDAPNGSPVSRRVDTLGAD
jgi:hypothetical protein